MRLLFVAGQTKFGTRHCPAQEVWQIRAVMDVMAGGAFHPDRAVCDRSVEHQLAGRAEMAVEAESIGGLQGLMYPFDADGVIIRQISLQVRRAVDIC